MTSSCCICLCDTVRVALRCHEESQATHDYCAECFVRCMTGYAPRCALCRARYTKDEITEGIVKIVVTSDLQMITRSGRDDDMDSNLSSLQEYMMGNDYAHPIDDESESELDALEDGFGINEPLPAPQIDLTADTESELESDTVSDTESELDSDTGSELGSDTEQDAEVAMDLDMQQKIDDMISYVEEDVEPVDRSEDWLHKVQRHRARVDTQIKKLRRLSTILHETMTERLMAAAELDMDLIRNPSV